MLEIFAGANSKQAGWIWRVFEMIGSAACDHFVGSFRGLPESAMPSTLSVSRAIDMISWDPLASVSGVLILGDAMEDVCDGELKDANPRCRSSRSERSVPSCVHNQPSDSINLPSFTS